MSRITRHIKNLWFWGIIALCLPVSFMIPSESPFDISNETIADRFQSALHHKEQLAEENIQKVLENSDNPEFRNFLNDHYDEYSEDFASNNIALLVYIDNKLSFWTENTPSVPFIDTTGVFSRTNRNAFKLGNGWYCTIAGRKNNVVAVALILLRHDYNYQNQYLVNHFPAEFGVPDGYSFSLNPENGLKVRKSDGGVLFYLVPTADFADSGPFQLVELVVFLIGLMAFLLFLWNLGKRIRPLSVFLIPLPIIILFLLRWLMLHFDLPAGLYGFESFSPRYFADGSAFPSFGDMALNVILILWSVLFLRKHLPQLPFKYVPLVAQQVSATLVTFFSGFLAYRLFSSLILNSAISFEFGNLVSIDEFSIIGIFCTGILFYSVAIIAYSSATLFVTENNKLRNPAVPVIAASGWIVLTIITHSFNLLPIAFSTFVFAGSILIRKKETSPFSFYPALLMAIIFAILSGAGMQLMNQEKEQEFRQSMAINLALEHDPIAESIFTGIERDVQNDEVLRQMLRSPSPADELIKSRLLGKYFTGYWSKYDIQITLCKSGDSLLIIPDNEQRDCYSFFDNIVASGIPSISCELYLLEKGTGLTSYIAELLLEDSMNIYRPEIRIYVEINSKFVHKGLGYPELLIDKSVRKSIDLNTYSYAIYNDSLLVNQFGRYVYSLNKNVFPEPEKGVEFEFFDSDGQNHLYYRVNKHTAYIISKKNEHFLGIITPFSYMIVFFAILFLLISLLYFLLSNKNRFQPDFRARIQWTMVSVVFTSLVFIGIVSILQIISLFDSRNEETLKEKAHSIQIELGQKIGHKDELNPELSDYIGSLLIQFSNVFFTDINVYDLDGQLIASSREKIFDEGLTGRLMEPVAYNQLLQSKSTLFIQKENIGSLEYLSAYSPFINAENKVIGFVNLPYFLKQSELTKELSGFLVALVNIYVLLFAVSIFTAVILSGYITKPLLLIRERMARIKLGATNETISWEGKDEIGNLINEYNRLVTELAESAEKLGRSERESAWKEMARQVAHEIKNPLTPMKLNVQYLEKAWKDKAPDWDTRLKRFTEMMIGQIDTLANIATAFSNFAQLPHARKEEVCLNSLLESTAALFRDFENVEVVYAKAGENECLIIADSSQLQQIFNNLVKNAVQSIPSDRKGKVELRLSREDEKYIVTISDNGSGIPEQIREKIFEPYFTSKSGGTGLGLAMAKSIVENFDGDITFTTGDTGTMFRIALPLSN